MYLSTFQREKWSEKEKWAHSPQPELEEHDRGPGLTLRLQSPLSTTCHGQVDGERMPRPRALGAGV